MSTHKIVFLGSKQSGLRALHRLVENLPKHFVCAVACPDDRDDRRSILAQFESYANTVGLPLRIVRGNADLADFLREHRPSVAVVHGWYRIICVADFPNTDFLGFHYSPLPRYRGNAPLVWQIINGESRLGVSFFALTPGMDEGALLDQRFFDLGIDETISDALDKANCLVDDMLVHFSRHLTDGKPSRVEQPDKQPSYCGMRIPDDGRVDWTQSAATIHNFIRAQTRPYPGSFTVLPDGRRMLLWKAAIESRIFFGTPGSVVESTDAKVVIACGTGAIAVIAAQVEGLEESSPGKVLGSTKIRLS